jgi:hypothetical protein
MQTTSAERAERSARSIEMSPRSKAKWQGMLSSRRISTPKQLLSRIRDVSGELMARKALKGERLDRQTWEAIFAGLKVYRDEYFTDIEWFDRDLKTQWQMLWNLGKDAPDRFGLVLPESNQNNDEKFLKTIVSRTSSQIELPGGLSGYLMLLERDARDNIILLAPSPLMANPVLTGAIQRLPQYPPSPFPFLQPITVGTNQLWAGVFPSLPNLKWLADTQTKPLRLQLPQLTELFEYVKQQPKIQMWKSSYVVTES